MSRIFSLLFLFISFAGISQNVHKVSDSPHHIVDTISRSKSDSTVAKIEFVEKGEALRQFKDEAEHTSKKEKRRTYIRYAFILVLLGTVIFIAYSSYKKKKELN